MSSSIRTQSGRVVGVLMAFALAAVACSTDGTETSETTEPSATTSSSDAPDTSGPTTTETSTTRPEVTTTVPVEERAKDIQIVDSSGLTQPESSWTKQVESFFVWGVDPDDVLNVRSGPGIDQTVVATISHNSGGLEIFDVIERVGSTNWVVVEVTDDGGTGWVASRFLKPQPPAGSPAIQGTASAEVSALVDQTIAALDDPALLAQLVGSQGLTVAPFTFIGSDTQTLTKQQVTDESDVERTWGFETGSGSPITSSLTTYLEGLATRNALVSTAEIGYDVVIGGGNTINNLAEVFPGATVVEYHHPGTSFFGGLDWTSVKFVFTEDNGELVLRALVSDQWEI